MPTNYTATTFSLLATYITAFMKPDGLRLLFVVSHPGRSKSWIIQNKLQEDEHVYVKAGNLTAFQFYKLLYLHRDRAIVLDDVEHALKDPNTRKLLMQACETDDKERKVGWYGTESQLVVKQGKKTVPVPQEFTCTSRVCVVSNDWALLNGKCGPLLDRGIVLFFDPPNDEIHRYVGEWFKDKEIYEFIGARLETIGLHSIRFYTEAREMKRHKLDWKAALVESWTNDKRPESPEDVLKKILADPALKTNEERVAAFESRTGLKRRSFYGFKAKLAGRGRRSGSRRPRPRVAG
jgi:hypothetical protein